LRKSLLILILTIFILASIPAVAGGEETDVNPIGNLNFADKVVYFLDHTSNPADGNWITLENTNADRSIQLPQPIRITYKGPKYEECGGVSGTLNKDEEESYTIRYPSTASYTNHPVYLPDENVIMNFHGESGLDGEVEIYLFKVTSDCIYKLFDAFQTGDIENLNSLFQDSVEGEYEKYNAELGNYGDLSYDLGCHDAGQYCIVMVQQNNDGSITVLSSTAFVVTEYELDVSSPTSIKEGKDLDISIELVNDDSDEDCTYGAVFIRKQAYEANIEINSDGTRDGTSVTVNDLDIIEEFEITSSNYRSKLTKNELQTEIQTLIGEGKGSIAIGEPGDKNLSLTTFDLHPGVYYLFVGAYSPEKGLVGLSQQMVHIKSNGSSNNDDDEEENDEPVKNIKIKEICKVYVSSGKRITFEFENKAVSVGYVEFNAKKSAGSITAIIEELKGRSSSVPIEPKGEVYKHLNIQVGNSGFANSKNIENAIVGFKVNKKWITENNINMDTITLQHFNGDQWDSLNTGKVGEDDEYTYFEAETPGFSPFAITASKNILEIGPAGEEGQSTLIEEQQGDSELVMGSEVPSKENGNSVLKIASFFIGFLVIIAIGTIIKKKADSNNEGKDSEK